MPWVAYQVRSLITNCLLKIITSYRHHVPAQVLYAADETFDSTILYKKFLVHKNGSCHPLMHRIGAKYRQIVAATPILVL